MIRAADVSLRNLPKMAIDNHDLLVERAKSWLRKKGCGVVLGEPFRARTTSRETPDAIGWFSDSTCLLVECKVSRSDFFADSRKKFRTDPRLGVGQWRFYLCPSDVLQAEDMPEGWGLLWATARSVKEVHNIPGNCYWRTAPPFTSNRTTEAEILTQAMRRMVIRGHLGDVYDGLGQNSFGVHNGGANGSL